MIWKLVTVKLDLIDLLLYITEEKAHIDLRKYWKPSEDMTRPVLYHNRGKGLLQTSLRLFRWRLYDDRGQWCTLLSNYLSVKWFWKLLPVARVGCPDDRKEQFKQRSGHVGELLERDDIQQYSASQIYYDVVWQLTELPSCTFLLDRTTGVLGWLHGLDIIFHWFLVEHFTSTG